METVALPELILEQIRRLSSEQQQKVLDFARSLTHPNRPHGESGASFLRSLADMEPFDPEDLEIMRRAADEDCEQIESDGW